MKLICLAACVWIAFGAGAAFGSDLSKVIAEPGNYEGQRLELIGIARVPGYFYLFADLDAASKSDLSKAVAVRRNFTEPEYRELDRQWVRVTGIMNSQPRDGWDSIAGVLLE